MKKRGRLLAVVLVATACLLVVGVAIGLLKEDFLAWQCERQLDSEDPEAILHAIDRLGELRALRALPRLVEGPPRIDGSFAAGLEHWTRALESILEEHGAECLDVLLEAIEESSSPRREWLLRLLQSLPPNALAGAAEPIGRLLADEDEKVVVSALAALGHIGAHAAGAVPSLLVYYERELPDDDDDGWGDLLANDRSVRLVYPPPSVATGQVVGILFAVAAREPEVVACALADVGWSAARGVLREALGQKRIDLILAGLQCQAVKARRYAATVLGEAEGWDEQVVRALEIARRNDADPRVRELAAQALALVGGR